MSDQIGESGGTPHASTRNGGPDSSPDQSATGGLNRTDAPLTQRSESNGLAIAAIVFGVGALFFMPIILGPIGIILSVMAKNRGQSMAHVGLTVAIVGTVIGLIFGFVAASMMVDNGIPEALHLSI